MKIKIILFIAIICCSSTYGSDLESPLIKTKWGQIHRHAQVVTFSKSKTIIKKPMNLGEHTNKILRELGYKQEEIKALANSSIIIEGK